MNSPVYVLAFLAFVTFSPSSSLANEKVSPSDGFPSLQIFPVDDRLQYAIDQKKALSSEITTRLKGSVADRRAALHALSLILTDESCEVLVGTRVLTPIELKGDLYYALGQHAWHPDFTKTGCKEKIKLALQAEFSALLSRLRSEGSIQSLSESSPESSALRELYVALGKWSFEDPHSFLLLAIRDGAGIRADTFPEELKASIVKGWMQARFARLANLPKEPVPVIPPEMTEILSAELSEAKTAHYQRILLFGAGHWKVALKKESVLRTIKLGKDRDLNLFGLRQFSRFPQSGISTPLTPFLKSSDALFRLHSFQAIVQSTDSNRPLLLDALRSEPLRPIQTMMLTAYLASNIASKGPSEAIGFFNSNAGDRSLGWYRAVALKGVISRLGSVAEKKLWISKGFLDPVLQVNLAASQAVGELAGEQAFKEEVVRDQLKQARHPLLISSLISLLKEVKPEDAQSYALIKSFTSSPSVLIRNTALGILWNYSSLPEFKVLLGTVLDGSKDFAFEGLRLDVVDHVSEKWKDEYGTNLLRELMTRDPSASVANAARSALLERGTPNLPGVKLEKFPYSPYSRKKLASVRPRILVKTTRGSMVIELFSDLAPMHARAFLGLIEKRFYDGMEFYRVEPDFVVQGGDREGTGWGNVQFLLRAENSRVPYERGSLGLARATPFDTGSSHFFFTLTSTPGLDELYTNFGKVIEGVSVLEKIELQDRILSATLMTAAP